MNSREAIKICIDTSQMVSMGYLEDLTDEQLMHRPHPECNHINWQLGHLIVSEKQMIDGVAPGSMPPLPAGFEEKYTQQTAKSNDRSAFCSKAELMREFEKQRAATFAALAKMSDQDLDRKSPESMQSYAPTAGAAFDMQGSHWMMHAGQWAVIRRQLGKPPLY